jgi:cyclin-dependent kinase 12/13
MGCVIGRQASSNKGSGAQTNRNKVDEASAAAEKNVVEIENDEKKSDDRVQHSRRSKPNPRLSNPPKHLHGEQVAAGWPSWLTAVCGEALTGWIPRKADTFEKIDKVG